MDKISQRLKQVITVARKGSSEDHESIHGSLEIPHASKYQYTPDDPRDIACDPLAMNDILKSIEDVYYSDIDASLFELKKFESPLQAHSQLRSRCNHLEKQNRTVCRRVSQLVLEKQPSYEVELKRVLELQASNSNALRQCRFARESLTIMKEGLIHSRAQVVANFRRRKKLEEVLRFLRRIRTFQRTVFQLKDLIEAEDFFGALELLRECQEVVQDYRHFECVNKLNQRLKNIQMQINEGLDRGLYTICEDFTKSTYDALQRAFTLLESTHASVNQLQMHYTTALHRRSYKIVLGFVQLTNQTLPASFNASESSSGPSGGPEAKSPSVGDLEALSYGELCQMIPGELLIPCLTALCKGLWQILHSYHQATLWHREALEKEVEDKTVPVPSTETATTDGTESSSSSLKPTTAAASSGAPADYILNKLEAGRVRMWSDVMEKVLPLVTTMSHPLNHFKFEEVLRVLVVVNRLVSVGEVFANSRSESVQEALRDQMLAFFVHFHRENLERLRMFLENEGWEACAVRSTFTVLDLVEFRPFRRELSSIVKARTSHSKKPLLDLGASKVVTSSGLITNGENGDASSGLGGSGVGGASPVSSSRGEAPTQHTSASEVSFFFAEKLSHNTPKNPFDTLQLGENATTEDFMEEELDVNEAEAREDVTQPRQHPSVSDDSDEEEATNRSGGLHRRSSHKRRSRPILANTTLELFRLMGRYLQMMHLLKPISLEVTKGVCQLFEYYFYSIFHLFVVPRLEMVQHLFTTRLKNCTKRIEERLVVRTGEVLPNPQNPNQTGNVQEEPRIPVPQSHSMNPPPVSGSGELCLRVVSMESLLYVGELLYHHLVPYMREQLLSLHEKEISGQDVIVQMPTSSSESQARALLHVLHHESLPAAWDLRQSAFQIAVLRLTPAERIPQRMVTVNWSSKEISSQCSPYVVEVGHMLDQAAVALVELRSVNGVALSTASEDALWHLLLLHIARWWVEGLAQVTQCSQEGRALMLMDLQHYAMKAETLCRTRPIPGKESIEVFIKAFYVPQQEMEEWALARKNMFTRRQLVSLVQTTVRDRKLRQNILQSLNQAPAHVFLPEALYGR